jgi:tRNA pseudouridine38-40 synthase
VGTDEEAASPFRRRTEWVVSRPLDADALAQGARALVGDHCFRGFAVRGTAPEDDDHRCSVRRAEWRSRDGGLVFEIEANRFLHHMVRFLVGTMMDAALGRRPAADIGALLRAADNSDVSPPAPPHALFLDRVCYPADLYLAEA